MDTFLLPCELEWEFSLSTSTPYPSLRKRLQWQPGGLAHALGLGRHSWRDGVGRSICSCLPRVCSWGLAGKVFPGPSGARALTKALTTTARAGVPTLRCPDTAPSVGASLLP